MDFDRFSSLGREQVAILVGPNGAGKSNFLRELASNLRQSRNLAVICNTAYDRFLGMRGIKRISAGRTERSPKSVVKFAVADTLDDDDSRFYQIAKVLDYCGYRDRIGFKVKLKNQHKHLDPQVLLNDGGVPRDIALATSYFERFESDEIHWVGDRERLLSYSQGREFASVLRLEKTLRKAGYLSDIKVYLQRRDGPTIELLTASSGELSLISSLLFLIANRDADPLVLVDEPENSLHPNWQREYVDKLLNALEYRNATIVIATHAPLIVTGALANARDVISVFQIDRDKPKKINLENSALSTESIEEILWRAFDVITPASHYVSEELSSILRKLEEGGIDSEAALACVNVMDQQSFDNGQRAFFEAVRTLIKKVVAERERQGRDG
ncbi:hypothetical protein TH25_23235 [Thalassospira profundimaris]|uniref:AAA+ ATPase domain-containing protein n=1 Tax=Thalassospira profundimaris TaxID=502049 RepID=A0A367WKP0_9PROT|nr:hypothetical protein TH25_23235 [Thalassospira profundimaris]